MTTLQRPINKDYSKTEGLDETGSPPVGAAFELFKKIPRLKRQRGRFRLPSASPRMFTHFVYHNPERDEWQEMGADRYEKIEVTEDTIRNTYFSEEERAKMLDDGGDFNHWTIESTDNTATFSEYSTGEVVDVDRQGHIWCLEDFTTLPFSEKYIRDAIKPPEEDFDLSLLGPKVWGIMKPAKPIVDLGVDIGEAREFTRLSKNKLDSLRTFLRTVSNPKGIADWFLALKFGYFPLLSDLNKCVTIAQKVKTRIEYLIQNAGKPLHQRLVWEPEITFETIWSEESDSDCHLSYDYIPAGGDPDSGGSRFKHSLVLRKEVTIRASGTYIYFWDRGIPSFAYLAAQLTGTILTPRVAWNVMRWSWLIDWFTSVGDVYSNFSTDIVDRQVSTSAYVQREVIREYTWTASNGFVTASTTRRYATKCRRKIDPFGLEFSAELNSTQQYILAALALTRV